MYSEKTMNKTMNKTINKQITFISLALLLSTSCASPGKDTAIGAGAGAVGGAGIGAIVGGGKGAAIGAGIGALAGGFVGNRLDKQAQELAQVAETKRTADGILVNLKNDLLFKTGSATLTPEANTQLNQLGSILVKYPNNHVTVAGYTDDVGSAAHNEKLSLDRAHSVQSVLLASGVPEGQLNVEGHGENDPLVPNKSKAARAKNRRVQLKITDPSANKG
jgi:outer membrane protein OmpA-like peptidoglycan-associated protein